MPDYARKTDAGGCSSARRFPETKTVLSQDSKPSSVVGHIAQCHACTPGEQRASEETAVQSVRGQVEAAATNLDPVVDERLDGGECEEGGGHGR